MRCFKKKLRIVKETDKKNKEAIVIRRRKISNVKDPARRNTRNKKKINIIKIDKMLMDKLNDQKRRRIKIKSIRKTNLVRKSDPEKNIHRDNKDRNREIGATDKEIETEKEKEIDYTIDDCLTQKNLNLYIISI